MGIKFQSRRPLSGNPAGYLGFRDNFTATAHSKQPFCPAGFAQCEVHVFRGPAGAIEFRRVVLNESTGVWVFKPPYGSGSDVTIPGEVPAAIVAVMAAGADAFQTLPGHFTNDPVDRSSTNPWNFHAKPKSNETGTYEITGCPHGDRPGSARCRSITHEVP